MLNNAVIGTRVKLANGLMATVTGVTGGGWSSTKTYSIRPDGGMYKTRTYREDGTNTDHIGSLYVVQVMVTDVKAQLEEAKAKVKELSDILEKQADDGSEEQMMDFGDGRTVKAKRHRNPQGDFGGFVAETASVDPSARISRGSVVYGNARVGRNVHLKNKSRVFGSAHISDGRVLDGVSFDGNTLAAVVDTQD